MITRIIGIDCATEPKKIGLAMGVYKYERPIIQDVVLGSKAEPSIEKMVCNWIFEAGDIPILLAIDAPLGWPAGLRTALNYHQAGNDVDVNPDIMFSRMTDRVVKKETGKRPLEVGANLIARTAHAALRLLNDIRMVTGKEIPLKWDWKPWKGVQAIEVYPALTLRALDIEQNKYKKEKGSRKRIVKSLKRYVDYSDYVSQIEEDMENNDDLIDAVLCVLAGCDFLRGKCVTPNNDEEKIAHLEGWIWFNSLTSSDL